MKTVIIGLGCISQTHIWAIQKGSFTKIAAVCDIREDRIQSARESLNDSNVREYTDYRKMIDEVQPDVVHVCTPHYLHCEMAVYAMRHGAHVYLEKPAAMNAEQAMEIVKVSEETGKKVCVSFQNRVIPTSDTAKKYIEEQKLGKLLGVRGYMAWNRQGDYYTKSGWRGTWEKEGGGVLMNQSIHTLDLLYYFGGKVKDIQGSVALRKNKDTIEVEDTAEATIWFESGATGIFYATNCNVRDSQVELEIYCEKGRLLLSNDRLYTDEGNGLCEVSCNDDYTKTVGKACWGNGHYMMMSRFYSAISGGSDYYCDIRDAVPVLEMIGGIYSTSAVKLR